MGEGEWMQLISWRGTISVNLLKPLIKECYYLINAKTELCLPVVLVSEVYSHSFVIS